MCLCNWTQRLAHQLSKNIAVLLLRVARTQFPQINTALNISFQYFRLTPRHELQGAAGVCARGARAGGGLQADQLLQAEGVRLQGPAGGLEEAACGAAGARPRARARRTRRHAAAGGHRHGRERDADPGHGGHRPRADHGLLLPAGGRSVHAGNQLIEAKLK